VFNCNSIRGVDAEASAENCYLGRETRDANFTAFKKKAQNVVESKAKQSSPPTRHVGAWGERTCSSYSFLTSALDWGEWSASRPGCALPRGKDPGTHCTGGWVGPRAGLDTEDRGKILCPRRESNPDRPVVQPVVRQYTA
jgi:hypothetical protein